MYCISSSQIDGRLFYSSSGRPRVFCCNPMCFAECEGSFSKFETSFYITRSPLAVACIWIFVQRLCTKDVTFLAAISGYETAPVRSTCPKSWRMWNVDLWIGVVKKKEQRSTTLFNSQKLFSSLNSIRQSRSKQWFIHFAERPPSRISLWNVFVVRWSVGRCTCFALLDVHRPSSSRRKSFQ